MAKNADDAIRFTAVSKSFLIGTFRDALRSAFGLKPKCPMVTALKDISFDVRRGELVGVLGRNGAGKSTLLRLAGGIYDPDQGSITIQSIPTAIFEMGLFGNKQLSGREFAEIYFEIKNIPKAQRPDLLRDVEDFAELGVYFDEPLLTYSTGMYARMLFGVVTAVPADTILLDEILSVGDEYFRGKSYKRFINLISHGASGIFATHDWVTAMRLCSRILILDHGEVEFQGTSQEAIRQYLKPNITMSKRVFFSDPKKMLREVLAYRCGEPLTYRFEIESTIDDVFSVELALEIPKLSIVAILSNNNTISGGRGHYRVTVHFPAFPIAYGDCYLSLFIGQPRLPGQPSEESFDQISWTNGESIAMCNDGRWMNAVFHRPFKWKRR